MSKFSIETGTKYSTWWYSLVGSFDSVVESFECLVGPSEFGKPEKALRQLQPSKTI
jgi:hypothetical protein